MRRAVFVVCVILVFPVVASAQVDWDAVHIIAEDLNQEVNVILSARNDLTTLERLDANIDDDALVSSLLAQIKSRASTAAQNLKDLLD